MLRAVNGIAAHQVSTVYLCPHRTCAAASRPTMFWQLTDAIWDASAALYGHGHGPGNGLAARGLAPRDHCLVRTRPGASGSRCGARAVATGARWADEFASAERAARRRPAAGHWRALLALRSGAAFRGARRVGGPQAARDGPRPGRPSPP